VLERIVRGGDDNAEGGTFLPRQHRDGGGGDHADESHVDPPGSEAGGDGALEHVAGLARVLADDDDRPREGVAAAGEEDLGGGLDEPSDEIGDERGDVRLGPDAVGAEVAAGGLAHKRWKILPWNLNSGLRPRARGWEQARAREGARE